MLKLLAAVTLPVAASWCGAEPIYPEVPPQEGPPTVYLSVTNMTGAPRRCAMTYAFDTEIGGLVSDPGGITPPGEGRWIAAEPGDATEVTISYACWHPDSPDLERAGGTATYALRGRTLSCLAYYGQGGDEPAAGVSCWDGEP